MNKRVVKVGIKSDPAKTSSSSLYVLQSNCNVEVVALGSSASVMLKAVCLVANLNNDRLKIIFQPKMILLRIHLELPEVLPSLIYYYKKI